MSRTHRKDIRTDQYYRFYRKPKTKNERAHLIGLISDNYTEDYKLSGMNRIHRRKAEVPTSWNDIVISSLYELDHHK